MTNIGLSLLLLQSNTFNYSSADRPSYIVIAILPYFFYCDSSVFFLLLFLTSFEAFSFTGDNQTKGARSGNGRGVGKCIHFSVKVIVQGQRHRETFSKKIIPSVGIRDREL